jgi:two-component sensor histidine kinase
MPIIVDQHSWGCFVLERNRDQPDWTNLEIEALRSPIRALGNLLARARIAEQLQKLASDIRVGGAFWISPPNGLSRICLSATSEQIPSQREPQFLEDPESWRERIHPEDLAKVESALSKEQKFDLEYRILRPDQSVRWLRDRGFPVWNDAGEISRLIGVTEDITKQKQEEDQVQQSIHLMAALIDKMGSSVLVEDESCRVCHVNGFFFQTLEVEVPEKSVLGSDSSVLFSQFPGLAERIEEIREQGIPLIGEELTAGSLRLKCSYLPLSISQKRHFHLWQLQRPRDEEHAVQPMETSLQEKGILREMHQSVSNDLRIIHGLLRLQSSLVREEQEFRYLVANQDRVWAMALVHDGLSKSRDLGTLDFPGYARNLAEQLVNAYKTNSQAVQLKLEVEPVSLDLNTAIPCGLIVNELVSNSLKYAFPGNRQGEILIRLQQEGDRDLRLMIRDDGIGFPKTIDFKRTQTLGLMLVTGLTEQLGGSIFLRNNNGTEFDIRFPLTE